MSGTNDVISFLERKPKEEHSIGILVQDKRTTKGKNLDTTFEWLERRNSNPIVTSETPEEYAKFSKKRQTEIKDVGGVACGKFRNAQRKARYAIELSIGGIDADHIPSDVDFPARVKEILPDTRWFIYSTHRHTKETPRCRLMLLFNRKVKPDEYPALLRMLAKKIGMDWIDEGSYETNRLFFFASHPTNGDFIFKSNAGEPLDVDAILSLYPDWHDCSLWPTSSNYSEVLLHSVKQQADPLEKRGVIGAFCRAYSIEDVIEKFLSGIYEPSLMDGRYDYIPADSIAGVVIYGSKFAYSHHATDPACGKLLNAFDLVRIHKFGDLEEKASFKAMSDLAIKDEKVKTQFVEERRSQAAEEFGEQSAVGGAWEKKLTICKDGSTEDTLENLVLIFQNDLAFKNLGYNEFKRRLEFTSPLPWESFAYPSLIDSDISEIRVRISKTYGIYSPSKTQDAMVRVAARRGFHPVRNFLDSLPEWDHIPRVDNLLVDYLGAEALPYTRSVTRKLMCAAVARIYCPGIKFDHVLVMDGAQGKGKSTLFNVLATDDWYNDSLSLTDMQDKAGAEKLQGYWIIEIGELAGMKKADIDKVKAFTSRKDDVFRPSYGRVVESHPRQCVIVATVNGDNRGYLRDSTGNRRFWPVSCPGREDRKPWDITTEERLQIWAEAKALWKAGEKLFLDQDMTAVAVEKQLQAMETDPREGIVEAFLDGLVPEGWDAFSQEQRTNFYFDNKPEGKIKRESITIIEVWVECLGNSAAKAKRQDSNEIAAILRKIGWEPMNKSAKVSDYGKQQPWVRRMS